MTPTTLTKPGAASTRAPIDLHREAMETLSKPEPTRAELVKQRAHLEGVIHAYDMADAPSLSEVQAANRAAERVREIDALIGKGDGTPEQKLQAMRIALESIVLHLTTRGTSSGGGTSQRITYDASFIQFSVAGMKKLIGRMP